jgi:hypothetical protein
VFLFDGRGASCPSKQPPEHRARDRATGVRWRGPSQTPERQSEAGTRHARGARAGAESSYGKGFKVLRNGPGPTRRHPPPKVKRTSHTNAQSQRRPSASRVGRARFFSLSEPGLFLNVLIFHSHVHSTPDTRSRNSERNNTRHKTRHHKKSCIIYKCLQRTGDPRSRNTRCALVPYIPLSTPTLYNTRPDVVCRAHL